LVDAYRRFAALHELLDHRVRYEDLVADPIMEISAALEFCGHPIMRKQVEDAIERRGPRQSKRDGGAREASPDVRRRLNERLAESLAGLGYPI
jgi:hypothetical protein